MKKFKKFISQNSDILSIILVITGIILTAYLINFVLKTPEKTTVNIISIIGTTASIFGLTVAFIQIISLQEISVITQETIKDTKDKLILGISISDVTEAISLVSEIDNYLGSQKYEISHIKLKELREKLIQFKADEEFKTIVEDNQIDEILNFINLHISSLHIVIYNKDVSEFNTDELNKTLQEIATYLLNFKTRIKYKTI